MRRLLSNRRLAMIGGIGVAVALAVAMGAGKKVELCPAAPSSVVLTALTSPSDLALSQKSAHHVAEQISQRAAEGCATLSVAVTDARPEADLALKSAVLHSGNPNKVPNRKPWVDDMREVADRLIRTKFLDPLAAAEPESGSPVMGAIAAVAGQEQAAGRQAGTLVIITDGIAVEYAPDGGKVDLRRLNDPASEEHLRSFIPELKGLAGGCVMIAAAGGDSDLGNPRIQRAKLVLGRVLHDAGIGFKWTRSLDLPADCRA
jgi:hypothetical protein